MPNVFDTVLQQQNPFDIAERKHANDQAVMENMLAGPAPLPPSVQPTYETMPTFMGEEMGLQAPPSETAQETAVGALSEAGLWKPPPEGRQETPEEAGGRIGANIALFMPRAAALPFQLLPEKVINTIEDVGKTILNAPYTVDYTRRKAMEELKKKTGLPSEEVPYQPPFEAGKPILPELPPPQGPVSRLGAFGREVYEGGRGFTTPGTVATVGVAKGLGLAAPKPTIPELYARSIEKTAAVHGDVQAQPREGARQVPVEEGGKRVQPQASRGVEEQAQVLLDKRIAELEADPEVTGRRVIGTTPEGRPKYEQVITNVNKTRELRQLQALRGQGEVKPAPVKKPTPKKAAAKPAPATGEALRFEGLTDNRLKASQTRINRSLDVRPDDPRHLADSANISARLGDTETAERLLREAKGSVGRYAEGYADKHIADAQAVLDRMAPKAEAAPGALPLEDQKYIEQEREGLGADVEYREPKPGEPFAGEIATIDRQKGTVVINPKQFSGWLNSIPLVRRAAAVKSLLTEERIHLAVTDAVAKAYWDTLTAFEKAINRRRYTGTWAGTETKGGAPVQITDTGFGHEALRFRMQQMMRLEPREVAEAVGRERITMQMITGMETAVRSIRETLGTEASAEAKRLLDKVESNLKVARDTVSGVAPAALAKYDLQKPKEDETPRTAFVSKGVAKPAYGEDFYAKQGEALKDPQFWVDWTYRHLKPDLNGQESVYQAGLYLRKIGIDEAAPIIHAMRQARQMLNERRLAALDRAQTGTPEERMAAMRDEDFALGSVIQFPREAIEAAFDEGSAKGAVPRSAAEPLKMPETIPGREPEVEAITPLDYQTGSPLTAMQSAVQRIDGHVAALRKEGRLPERKFRQFDYDYRLAKLLLKQRTQQLDEFAMKTKGEEMPGALELTDWLRYQKRLQDYEKQFKEYLEPIKPAGKDLSFREYGNQLTRYGAQLQNIRELAHHPMFSGDELVLDDLNSQWLEIKQKAKSLQENYPWHETLRHDLIAGVQGSEGEPRVGPGLEPGAIRKGKGPEDYPELFGPAEIRKQKVGAQLSRPERGEALGELRKAEAAMYEPLTPEKAQQAASEYLARPAQYRIKSQTQPELAGIKATELQTVARPNFPDFVRYMKSRFGPASSEGPSLSGPQLRDLWIDSVWNHLMKAPGGVLSRLQGALGLGREGATAGGRAERVIAEPVELPEVKMTEHEKAIFDLLTQAGARGGKPPVEFEKYFSPQLKQRYRIIANIARKLINESTEGVKQLNRREVVPKEIAFWKRSSEPAYNIISNTDRANPSELARILTADAGEDRTTKIARIVGAGQPIRVRRKALPMSATRRLTVMEAVDSKRVEMVSTYKDSRRGTVLLDPNAPFYTHTPLAQMLKRYRPLYSILLDEPVQNFRRTFKNKELYQKEFGNEARGIAEEHVFSEAELPPGAGVLESEFGEPSGILSARRPVHEPEVRALYNNLKSSGTLEAMVDRLHQQFEDKGYEGLNAQDWASISVLQKLANKIQRRDRSLTPDQAKQEAFDELETLAKTARDADAFAYQIVNRYAPQTRPSFRGEPPPPKEYPSSARELTTLRAKAPTTVPGEELPKGPGPEPQLPPPDKVSMLTPEEQAALNTELIKHHPPRFSSTIYRQLAQRKVPKRPYTMKHEPAYVPEEGEALQELPPEDIEPAAIRKGKTYVEDKFLEVVGKLRSWGERRQTSSDIVAWRDGAETTARNAGRQAGNAVRIQTEKPRGMFTSPREYFAQKRKAQMIRAAAKAVIAAAGEKGRLDNFILQVETGRVNAESMLASRDPFDRVVGRLYMTAVNRLRAELDYAKEHWDDADLQATVTAARKEFADELAFEQNNGVKLNPVKDYVPGRYESEFFNDKAIVFGERILGRNFRKPKVFGNYYSAIQAGPYIPKSYDIADLVEHRVRSGRNIVNRDLWLNSIHNLRDPVSNQMVVTRPKIKDGKSVPPSLEYELFSLGPGHDVMAVRVGYKDLLDVMTQPSGITKTWPGKAGMAANSLLKHGVILILDTFHGGRLGQYALSLVGVQEVGFRRGWAALDYRAEDVATAVKNGWVSPESAAWADGKITIRVRGRDVPYTRREILGEMQKQGLNVGRVQDAIYMDIVRSWPVVGTLNRFTFDVLTRGIMAEGAVKAFEELNAKYPNRDARRTMRYVIHDINTYYGSIGRQGWIRNPTVRDAAQLLFLAPQWVEGLIKKEALTYWRVLKSPYSLAKGEPVLGPLGKGMARGLVSYFVLTQILNLITRRHTTFQNPEDNHKLDAWIPTGKDSGFWLSPLSVFGEITHDITRLGETKPTNFEAIRQIGSNKLGPAGRMMMIFWSRENEKGQRITSTPRAVGAIAQQLAPAPISLGVPLRYVGHKIAPTLIGPTREGAMQQRLLGAIGIKVQTGETMLQQAQHLAGKFVETNQLKPDSGFVEVPTDQPSYSKLRRAIANDDPDTARSILKDLRKARTDEDIMKAMTLWAQRPLTGSWENELMWMQQMDDETFKIYSAAIQQRQDIWNKWLSFYITEPIPLTK